MDPAASRAQPNCARRARPHKRKYAGSRCQSVVSAAISSAPQTRPAAHDTMLPSDQPLAALAVISSVANAIRAPSMNDLGALSDPSDSELRSNFFFGRIFFAEPGRHVVGKCSGDDDGEAERKC
jgi:hypothetical protein